MAKATLLAPCGIDCAACDIYVAAHDPQAAERLAAAWCGDGRTDARPEWFRCQGCRRHRDKCWSADCAIRACCVDEKGLIFCADCCKFPCQKLEDWALNQDHHREALERLHVMSQEFVGTPPPI